MIRTLEPQVLWNKFADLNAVPRASKKEEEVIAFMKAFGENLGLDTLVDHIGNVIIKKPATPGMEDRMAIVMQSHLDMVHQKNADVDFDFATEGIRMLVKGDWIHAEGTTLGADNGIGVATIMALLESTDIEHPAIEALFTIDEETGMTGALELKPNMLTGKILLNLDTEDDDELTIGCAGGVDVTLSGNVPMKNMPTDEAYTFKVLAVRGLSGGHSGMDIHKGLGNANKLMNRILRALLAEVDLKVHAIDGGSLRNAIPRESFCRLAYSNYDEQNFNEILNRITKEIEAEHGTTDPDLRISLEQCDAFENYVHSNELKQLVRAIYACPNGIYRMCPDIDGLVQTSNNLARVSLENGSYQILCLTRSSVDSEKDDLKNMIQSVFELIGATVEFSGSYPGWTPKPGAEIVSIMDQLYQKMFDQKMKVAACHAGLECGIIGTHYPDMEMVSFGPNIRGAHSPDEKVQISSVQKYWNYTLAVLKSIPKNQ